MKKKLFKINNNCRLCSSRKLDKVVDIGSTPVSEKYSSKKNSLPEEKMVPLNLYFCNNCSHIQLVHVVDPDYLWDNFTFKTSRNPKLNNHYSNYVNDLIKFAKFTKKNFVLDIGSNDGTLLKIFKKNRFKKFIGVDPAKKIAKEANKSGIPTIIDYMNSTLSEKIVTKHGKADFITANNVYAHINNMSGLTDGIKNALSRNGLFVFEVSYLLDVIKKKLLGTIFHEHLSYHSLFSLIKFFKKKNLQIVKVRRNSLQGGSLVCYVQHFEGPYKTDKSVEKILNLEKRSGLNKRKTFIDFSKKLKRTKITINKKINEIIKKDKKISGFGSARSATTLIKFFNIGSKINFIVDDNKGKHFKFTPGDRIKVLPSNEIYKGNTDYLVIFAWEHQKKIMKKHIKFKKLGGKFINILPDFKVIS